MGEDYPPPSATLESISMFSNFAAFSLRSSMSMSRPVGVFLTLISFSSRISTNLDLYHKPVLSIKTLSGLISLWIQLILWIASIHKINSAV